MEKIAIENFSLARSIFLQLINDRRVSSILEFDSKFTEQQLSSIRSLLIESTNDLTELDKLPNLTSLIIANDFSRNTLNIEPDINHIKDFRVLKKIKSLEKIIILNDFYIEELDITDLQNLRRLIIINNPFLKRIIGIDSCQNLEKMIIYGNQQLELETSIFNNEDGKKRKILDVHSLYEKYFSLAGIDTNTIDSNIIFAEKIGYGEAFFLSLNELLSMYNIALSILKKIIKPNMNDLDKIEAIYRYVIGNVEYDYKTMAEREEDYIHNAYHPLDQSEKLRKFRIINTAFSGIIYKKGNCEALSNTISFLLKIIGITANTIYTYKKDGSYHDHFDHAALKILTNTGIYYSDPEEDKIKGTINIFLTKNEFLNQHAMSPFDLKVESLIEKKQKIRK